ncbi:hypothetical protein BV25DRAFT_1913666 [Artomyces pyxidatus]|uniref:Uncharacterized protein n=1 Tax=Artomyces pyxidatus TaxID=48021 RepID=A0ACB8TB55_9AGAM|nr:hypothetical protein BV25DRAFT_1913666 [Artomyces pyxidatus]
MGTRPVTDYITEFEALKGLNTALLDDLVHLDPVPDTLEKWKSRAIERNAAYLERIREMAARKGASAFAPRTPKAGTSPSQNANRTRTLAPVSPGTLGKLTDDERNCLCQDCPQNQGQGGGRAPQVRAVDVAAQAPAVAPAPPAPAAPAPLAVPPVNRAMAALSAQILALDAEQQEEAKAALKDMVEGF